MLACACFGIIEATISLFLLEAVSKPVEDDKQAGKLNEAIEEVCVVFVSDDEASEVMQPRDGSLDNPSVSVPPEFSTVLSRPAFASPAVRAHEFCSAFLETLSKPVRVGRFVVQQMIGHAFADPNIEQRFHRVDLGVVGGEREHRQRDAVTVNHQHQLAAFASFGLTNVKAPFFAGENVPSPAACDQCSKFRRSIRRRSRRQASSQTPDSVHSRCRRWHVEGEGYRSGKSCHRAPFFRTQMMPSRHSRGVTRGRPPLGDAGGLRNRSRMIAHWASVINGFGAVLDPVVFGRRRGGHIDREMVMQISPFNRRQSTPLAKQTTFHGFDTASRW